jgi:hypothetical protein
VSASRQLLILSVEFRLRVVFDYSFGGLGIRSVPALRAQSGKAGKWKLAGSLLRFGLRLLTDGAVGTVGEFPSIRAQRCAPGSDCWARVDTSGERYTGIRRRAYWTIALPSC